MDRTSYIVARTLTYEASGSEVIKPSNSYSTMDTLFTNTDTDNCPITSCTLYDAGSCGTGTFSGAADITIGSTAPFEITASKGVAAGYTYNICVQCQTQDGEDTAVADNWSVT
jgi:hypothetical protein